MAGRKKLVLAVIDSLKPDVLDLAIEEGRAPALAALRECGTYVRDCLSTFPSVTPVASAAIATGYGPGEHHIPSMNWYHRGEERYIEYGSSFPATRAFGVVRSLYDTVYNMNMAHLTRAHRTVFEHLDDAGLRTACTTWLIYRGRTRHDPSGTSVYRRIAEAAQFRHPVYGARELFYADLFDSRNTGCTSALGLPGQRDRHTGCVGAYLVEHDLFDFLLFSLPDNDTHSHKAGPDGQIVSIAEADRALERIMHVAGGVEAFLEQHAVIVMSDHSQTKVEERVNLSDAVRRRARAGARRSRAGGGRAGALPLGAVRERLRPGRGAPRRARGRRGGHARGERRGGPRGHTRRRHRHDPQRARRAALPARHGAERPPRAGLAARGRARRPGSRRARRPRDQRDLSRPAQSALVGARVPALGRRAGVGGDRLRVRRLGRGRPRGRGQPRLPASRRFRGCAACSAGSTHPSARSGRSTDVAPLVLDHFSVPLPG